MMPLLGAIVLTYFVSRALRWFGLRPPSVTKLVAAHVLSLVILILLALALRYPLGVFMVPQLTVYLLAQAGWLLVDLYRAQVAFWKPPVAAVTEPSSTGRAGSSP
jgi:predicted PurR-regulated permease PerM